MSQVFLTYSLKDEREAAQIRNALCRLGLDVWWDAELPTKTRWAHEVGRALDRCDCMVVLVTPRALDSDLVSRELDHAITHANFRNRLFPLIVEATPKLPGYFAFLDVFDLTRDRTGALAGLAKAIKRAQKQKTRS